MSTLFPLPHPPHREWKAALESARNHVPDVTFQIIWEARRPGALDHAGWHAECTRAAIALLTGLPRAETRLRRLRGHLRRWNAQERQKAALRAAAEKAKAAEDRRKAKLAEYLSPEFAPPPHCGK